MTWRLASMAGVDPLPMSFGELVQAFDAKCDYDRLPQAELMALIANCNKGASTRPYKSSDFYRPKIPQKRPKRTADLGMLKAMFTRPA